MKLNVGCGPHHLEGYVNLDADPEMAPDVLASVPPLPFGDESLEEIYAGHFLEHLSPEDARLFLAECHRCLVPGGQLGIVVPDTRAVAERYVAGAHLIEHWPDGQVWDISNLEDVCKVFVYATCQTSRHQWSYDLDSLRRLLESAGFQVLHPIDRMSDPRLVANVWFQCGWECIKGEGS